MPRVLVSNLGSIGVIKDIAPYRLPANSFTEAQNAAFTLSGVESVEPAIETFNILNGTYPLAGMDEINWFGFFQAPDGEFLWPYASVGTDKMMGVLFLNGTGYDSLEITRASGNYNNIASQRWHAYTFQGLGIFNQEMDIPQLWNPIDKATALVNMPNWSTNPEGGGGTPYCRVRVLRPYKNFLISLFISNSNTGDIYPYRVRWSDPAPPGQSPITWDVADPGNLAGEQDLAESPDYLVDGLTLGEIFVIYKERTTYGMQFVQGQYPMRFWTIFPNIGAISRDCVAAFPGGHFVATHNDLIWHTGAPNSNKSILRDRIRKWYTENINLNKAFNAFAITCAHAEQVLFFFPTRGHTFANKCIFWSWNDNTIGIRDAEPAVFGLNCPVTPIGTSDAWG